LFSPLVFVRKNRASKKERGKEEDARARARYGFFFGFSTSSDDGEKSKLSEVVPKASSERSRMIKAQGF